MALEFERYQLEKYRVLVGWLEILGAVGLIVGLKFNLLFLLATCGLAVLMGLGVYTRYRVGDSILQIMPALLLFLVCCYLFVKVIVKYFS